MSENWRRPILVFPFILGLCMYSANLARIVTLTPWVFWIVAFLFILLLGYVAVTAICALIFLMTESEHAQPYTTGMVLGVLFVIGHFGVARLVTTNQDQMFLKNLAEYEQAVKWIESNAQPPANGQLNLGCRFPNLANQIRVQTGTTGGLEVFFVAYPGMLRKGLRGYAYNSAETWSSNFVSVYGEPRKLTNRWYRI